MLNMPFLQSLFCKSAAGLCFQVSLEIKGFIFISKCKYRFEPPGTVFRGVGAFPIVVIFQSLIKFFCEASIKVNWDCFGLQDINIKEFHLCWRAGS